MKDKIRNNSKALGFTLVELLIVVAVIGILSGLSISVINPTALRARTRDSQRISDLKKIQTALELRFTDVRSYPSSAAFATVASALTASLETAGYISDMPVDPVSTYTSAFSGTCPTAAAGSYAYSYKSTGSTYVLVARMETTALDYARCNTVSVCSTYGCNCGDYCHAVQNPF